MDAKNISQALSCVYLCKDTNLKAIHNKNIGLPLDDDWLYEIFKVQKPADYDKKKADAEAQKEALR